MIIIHTNLQNLHGFVVGEVEVSLSSLSAEAEVFTIAPEKVFSETHIGGWVIFICMGLHLCVSKVLFPLIQSWNKCVCGLGGWGEGQDGQEAGEWEPHKLGVNQEWISLFRGLNVSNLPALAVSTPSVCNNLIPGVTDRQEPSRHHPHFTGHVSIFPLFLSCYWYLG